MNIKKKFVLKKTASSDIVSYFEKAYVFASKGLFEEAKRQVFLGRRLSMKFKLPIPRPLKRKFCRYCNSFFVSGKNCTIRTRDKRIVYRCLSCNRIRRLMLH